MYLPYFGQDLESKKKVVGILAHVWLQAYTKFAFASAERSDLRSRAKRSVETSSRLQTASSVEGGLSIGRILQVDGAPPDDSTRLPEDDVRFERLMQTGASLTPGRKVI